MVDGIVLFFVFVMFFIGFSRGTLHQFWALAVLVVATSLSGALSPSLATFMDAFIPNTVAANLASFVLVFGVTSGVLNTIDGMIRHRRGQWDQKSNFADRSIGSILAIVEAIGTVEVAAALLVAFPIFGLDTWIASSRLLSMIFSYAPAMMHLLPMNFQKILQLFI